VVLTFFPHPDVVLRGELGRYYLTTPEYRAQLLLDLGVDAVITHPFNEATRQQRAQEFVSQLLEHIKMVGLWVGEDFALGYKREGNIEFLRQQGQVFGFEVTTLNLVGLDQAQIPVSSSRIRQLLRNGDVANAQQLLNRPYSVSGRIVTGFQRGRMIGFPTANIDVWEQQLIPQYGVYSGWASFEGERHMAVTNVGIRPTFDGEGITIEAHLLDFDRDIYGVEMHLTMEQFLRAEMKFSGIDALKEQLARDVEASRAYLSQA
jgi:riboflavin kinase/FMN adenylyltransferase